MQYDIFISYRRSDQPVARALVGELEQRGVRVWWDQKIEGGEDWRDAIVEGLQGAQCLVILFSEECNDSKQLKKELAIADTLNKLVVPVLIEDTQPRGHYLYELAALNWIQVFPNPASRAGDLADRLVRELGLEQIASAPAVDMAPVGHPAMQEEAVSQLAPDGDTLTVAPATPGGAAPEPMGAHASPSMQPAPRKAAPALDADAVREKAERKRQRDSRRKTMRDFLPLHWYDIFPLAALAGLLYYEVSSEWWAGNLAETVGVSLILGGIALGAFGAVIFPFRYYLRRRRVWRTAMMQALNSLVPIAMFVGGLLIWWEGDTASAFDESFIFIPPIFITLTIVAIVIYGILNGQRAVRSFRKNVEVL